MNLPVYDDKKFHLGIGVGLNNFNFIVKPNSNLSDSIVPFSNSKNIGYNFSFVTNIRINDFSDIRFVPGFSINKQSIDFNALTNGIINKESYTFNVSQFKIPLLYKFKFKRLEKHKNSRPYILFGCMYSVGISRKQTFSSVNQDININNNDLSFIFGIGLDKYLPYLKFSTELNFSIGIIDLNSKDDSIYSRSIDKLTSRVINLVFYFE